MRKDDKIMCKKERKKELIESDSKERKIKRIILRERERFCDKERKKEK